MIEVGKKPGQTYKIFPYCLHMLKQNYVFHVESRLYNNLLKRYFVTDTKCLYNSTKTSVMSQRHMKMYKRIVTCVAKYIKQFTKLGRGSLSCFTDTSVKASVAYVAFHLVVTTVHRGNGICSFCENKEEHV